MGGFLKEIKAGDVTIFPNIFLAPMAGITNKFFREIVLSLGGCGLTFSELISSEAIIRNHKNTFKMMERGNGEKPFSVQIYGFKAESMSLAARIIEDRGLADMIDINAGCPAKKVVKNGAGSGMLRDLKNFERIISSVVKSVSIPVSVKMRAGFDFPVFLEAAKIAVQCGVSMITLHPRLRREMFSGKARWEYIRILKEKIGIPVIGNGDIFSVNDAVRMFDETKCDGIMVGRGITKNPFLMRDIFDFLRGNAPKKRSPLEKVKILYDILSKIYENLPEKAKLGEMKRFSSFFISNFKGASKMRTYIFSEKNSKKILDFVGNLIENFDGSFIYEEKG